LGLHGSATQTYAAALEALQKGLALADHHNYRNLRLTVLTNLGIIYRDMGDFSQSMARFGENLHLTRQVGKLREIVLVIANLGTLALLLGDYDMALAYFNEAQQMIGELGEQRIEAELLALHTILYEQMGNTETALRYCQQTLDLADRYHFYHPAREAWIIRGHLQLRQGAFSAALAAYQQANALSTTTGVKEELLQGQAAIAAVRLAQGDSAAALAEVEQVLQHFDAARFNPFQSPQRILLTCYRVLEANHDPRAAATLQRAIALLEDQAAQISDPALSRSYRHNVPVNRELTQLANYA
jgi:tetratricopeptide (TPR) repeat protein